MMKKACGRPIILLLHKITGNGAKGHCHVSNPNTQEAGSTHRDRHAQQTSGHHMTGADVAIWAPVWPQASAIIINHQNAHPL